MKKSLEEKIWLSVNDVATGLIDTDDAVEEIKKHIKRGFEGKFINGDFFLEQPDGSYISMNSLSRLPKPKEDKYGTRRRKITGIK